MTETPRILLIRRRYLGDVVLLGSVLRNLRLHWPGAAIDLLTEAPYAGVAALHPDARAALAFPARAAGWPALTLVAVNDAAPFWERHGFVVIDPPGMADKLASYGADARYMIRHLTGQGEIPLQPESRHRQEGAAGPHAPVRP